MSRLQRNETPMGCQMGFHGQFEYPGRHSRHSTRRRELVATGPVSTMLSSQSSFCELAARAVMSKLKVVIGLATPAGIVIGVVLGALLEAHVAPGGSLSGIPVFC